MACIAEDSKIKADVRGWDRFWKSYLTKEANDRSAERVWREIHERYLNEGATFLQVVEGLFAMAGAALKEIAAAVFGAACMYSNVL